MEDDGGETLRTIYFDFTVADTRRAVAGGCVFFSWFLKDENIKKSLQFLNYSKVTAQASGSPLDIFGITFGLEGDTFSETGGLRRRHQDVASDGFCVVAFPDNKAGLHVSTRPVNTAPGSEQSLSLAHSWLQSCLQTHETCQKRVSQFMPTRVVEIQRIEDRWHLALKDPEWSMQKPYATLSYCWGGDQPIKLTNQTIHRWRGEIPWQELPKTLQDAVVVTSNLSISFLWVDSLCIIQDDPEDKAREIALMPNVYSQTTVTIVASRAKNVQEGFLHNRQPTASEYPEQFFELPFQCPDGVLGSVLLLPWSELQDLIEPLDERAWALQERLLSPRILDFGSRQTRLICQDHKCSRDSRDGWTVLSPLIAERESYDLFLLNSQSGPMSTTSLASREPDPRHNMRALVQWQAIVNSYTQRKLTVSTDRLLAISAVAERFATFFNDEYLAGLWKFALPYDLLWELDPNATTMSHPRPSGYQAPSWSWGAVNSIVRLGHFPEVWDAASGNLVDNSFEILDHKVQLSSIEAKFGAVTSGYLIVKGRILPATWQRGDQFALSDRDLLRRRSIEDPRGRLAAWMQSDAIEDEFTTDDKEMSVPVFLLSILGRVHEGRLVGDCLTGLVLRGLGNDIYSRLGIFEFSEGWLEEGMHGFEEQLKWFVGREPQIVTIV